MTGTVDVVYYFSSRIGKSPTDEVIRMSVIHLPVIYYQKKLNLQLIAYINNNRRVCNTSLFVYLYLS